MRAKITLFLGTLLCATALNAQSTQAWVIGPFTRPASGNPVITPKPESTFNDPILK